MRKWRCPHGTRKEDVHGGVPAPDGRASPGRPEPGKPGKEFEPSANTIRKWAEQADLDEGIRTDGLTTAERGELRELRRENRQLKLEREILGKSAA